MSIKEIAPVANRENLKSEIKGLEGALKGGIGTSNPNLFGSQRQVDRGGLKKRLDIKKETLARVSVPEISEAQSTKLNKRKEKLEAEIGGAMLSRDEMMGERAGRGRAAYPGAITREVRFQKEYSKKIRELKQICRQIDPDNPDLPNLERLRPMHRVEDSTGSRTMIVNPGIPQ